MNAPDPLPSPIQRLDQYQRNPYTRGEYIRRYLWAFVERTLFRLSPPRAFGWRAMLLRGCGATIGPHTRIARTVTVMHPWLLDIGEWSSVGACVEVYNLGRITIGRHTAISQYVTLCAGTHDHRQPNLPLIRSTIRVGDGVWIAAQAFVGPDVSVGDGSVVGARSVVVRDVPPGVVAAGNPAKPVGARRIAPPPPSAGSSVDTSRPSGSN